MSAIFPTGSNVLSPIFIDRFIKKIKIGSPDECWEWQAGLSSSGYGRYHIPRRMEQAHRVSWMIAFGEIPDNLHVLHKCDNRKCVNPHHLFLGTNYDNIRDMISKGRSNFFCTRNSKKNSHKGEHNPNSKLTNEQVQKIRNEYAQGAITKSMLARKYEISRTAIREIIQHKKWKNL